MMAWGAGPFSGGPWGGAIPIGSVTDVDLIKGAQYRLLENGNADADGVTLLTDMYTIEEMVDAIDQRQQKFLLDTGMIGARTTILATQGVTQYDLPEDNIMPRRVTWITSGASSGSGYGDGGNGEGGYGVGGSASGSNIVVLTRVDSWELDNGQPDWASDDQPPIAWYDNILGQQKIGITRPNQTGTIGLLYIQLAAALTGAGVAMTIPDDWTPYVLWGALADLLNHDGSAYDPVRGKYCEQRYQEGIELARLVLKGA